MGMFNYLQVNLPCPRCGVSAELEAEFRCGPPDLKRYEIGDTLPWQGALRPPDGNFDGEAYAVCPHCGRDFWLRVQVREDVILWAEVDASRQGYLLPELSETFRLSDSFIIVRRCPYEEPYHTQLEFVASNGAFHGRTDLYCAVEDLQEIGLALQKFPSRAGDEYCYEYGTEDPQVRFYRYFLLRAYTVDALGNCALQIAINLRAAEPEEGMCKFSLRADAASINRLGELFVQFAQLRHLEFRWSLRSAELFERYQLSDFPTCLPVTGLIGLVPPAPKRGWDQAAYAVEMGKKISPVSAFFLVDSLAALDRSRAWLEVLKPYGLPEPATSAYLDEVHQVYQERRQVRNFDHDFHLLWKTEQLSALLRCHSVNPGQYELELWLPGVIASEIKDQFQDGHSGFMCAFMPPAFYD